MAWDKICRPKKYGGLGLRKTRAVNKAFLTKLSWKVISQSDNFLLRHLRAKYGSLNMLFTSKATLSDSWVLEVPSSKSGILQARNSLDSR